jgi:streptogramin lyase
MQRFIVQVLFIAMSAPLAAQVSQLPRAFLPAPYTEELRAIIGGSPVLTLESKPVPFQAAGLEMGMVSWIASDRDGLVYLLQRGANADAVIVLDASGKVVRSWGKGMYVMPHAIRVDPAGNVWTTDAKSSVVMKFSPDGTKLLQIDVGGVPADCDIQFCGTTDVAFGPRGQVFITDGYRNARVLEYTSDGRLVRQWGKAGRGPGEFFLPHSIVVDEQNVIYVADRENARIQRFDLQGRFLGEWPKYGKTFSLALGPGVVWLGTQWPNESNLTAGWLLKVDRRTGNVLGYVNSTGVHGLNAGRDGELRYSPGPQRQAQVVQVPK